MNLARTAEKKILWTRTSRYGEIRCFDASNGSRVAKIEKSIMPWHLKALPGLERKETIEFINKTTLHYRNELNRLGIPTVPDYECFDINGEEALHVLSFIGKNAEEIIDNADAFVQEEMLIKIFQSISGALYAGRKAVGNVGLDPQLSNFCMDQFGKIFYIDLFPPLCQYEGSLLVHFPNPTQKDVIARELKRKFHYLGILRRLRFGLLMMMGGDGHNLFMTTILKALGQGFYDEVKDYFLNLPDQLVSTMTRANILEMIEKLGIEDTDEAREIALKIVPLGGRRKVALEKIFDLSSSFSSHGVPASERLAQLKLLLRSFVTS